MKLSEAQKNILRMMYSAPTESLEVGRTQYDPGVYFGSKRLHTGSVSVLIKNELLVLEAEKSNPSMNIYRLSNEGFIVASQL